MSANGENKSGWPDLVPRILSGLVLALVVLVLTYAGPLYFALLLAAGSLVLCWEWAGMVRGSDFDELLVLHALSVLAALAFGWAGHYSAALIVLLVGPAVKFILTEDKEARRLALSLVGVPYVGLPMLALLWLRGDPQFGFAAIVFLFVVVWTVDIFAYFIGRSVGGPKLAPRVSPKKTWSGFIGGVSAGGLAGLAFAHVIGSPSPLWLAVFALVLGMAAQMGDLFESAFKRHLGVKDSSQLIPGHGGLFDRVDGLMAAALLAALAALALGPALPGAAILMFGSAGP